MVSVPPSQQENVYGIILVPDKGNSRLSSSRSELLRHFMAQATYLATHFYKNNIMQFVISSNCLKVLCFIYRSGSYDLCKNDLEIDRLLCASSTNL